MTAADRLPLASVPAASLLAFTPQAAAASWMCAPPLTDEGARAVTVAAAACLTAAVAPRAVARRQPDASGPELRVLTANLLAGRAAAGEVVELVRATAVDVCFVQELSHQAVTRLSGAGLDQLLPYSITDFGAVAPRGNAIYARHPLSEWRTGLPTSSIQPFATLKLPATSVRLACVHLQAPKRPWSRSGAARWQADLAALSLLPVPVGPADLPLVLAGDFNSTVDHIGLRRALGRGLIDAACQSGNGLVPTWGPAPGGRFALVTIDHVLADHRCAVLSTSVHPLTGTDHRAVFARLRLASLTGAKPGRLDLFPQL
jgi:endonuclease/exonuclease/phosphatase family metal-dependent hydrolase